LDFFELLNAREIFILPKLLSIHIRNLRTSELIGISKSIHESLQELRFEFPHDNINDWIGT